MKFPTRWIYNAVMAPPRIEMIGRSFGKWTVLRREEGYPSKNTHWLCRCECGFEKPVDGTHLRKGHSVSCRKCSDGKPKERLNSKYWHHLKYSARMRDIEFKLTKEYLWKLYLEQDRCCALTGLKLAMAATIREHTAGGTTASVDRIDSSKGYIKGNVQWVHKVINKMKWGTPQEEFIEFCEAVVKHKGKIC